MKPTIYRVPALDKGLDVIEALASAVLPQSLVDLERTVQRSRDELFRTLRCLERRGYIMRDRSSAKYSLTLKLYSLAHLHARNGILPTNPDYSRKCRKWLEALQGEKLSQGRAASGCDGSGRIND